MKHGVCSTINTLEKHYLFPLKIPKECWIKVEKNYTTEVKWIGRCERLKNLIIGTIDITKLKFPPPPNSPCRSSAGFPGIYTVVKCGAACHNVRSKPSLQAPPVGMMVLGNQVEVLDQVINSEGTWVKINPEIASKYCFNHVTEAWSLAQSPNNELYLQREPNSEVGPLEIGGVTATSSPKKGYDFTMANTSGNFVAGEMSSFSFTPPRTTPPQSFHASGDPFVFGYGSPDMKLKIDKKNVNKLIKEEDKSMKVR